MQDQARTMPLAIGPFGAFPQHLKDWLFGLLDATPGLVMVWNPLGRLYYLNARGRSMLGLSASDNLAAYRIADFYSVRGYEAYLREALPACLESGVWHGETTLIDRHGRQLAVSQLVLAHGHERAGDGDVAVFSSIAWDIGDHKRTEQALRHRATHDALTGLPNRTLLLDRLKQAIHVAQRHGYIVAVLFLDVDDFKAVNDTYGHEPANGVLRTLAERLNACMRAEDTVARYGGDEFVIVVPDLRRPGDCSRVLQKVEATLDEPFLVNGRPLDLSVSIGIAAYPDDGREAAPLLHTADAMMYRVKRAANRGGARPKDPRRPLCAVS